MALNTRLSLLSSRNTATASAVSLFLPGHRFQQSRVWSTVVQQIQLSNQAIGAQNSVLNATMVMLLEAADPVIGACARVRPAVRPASVICGTPVVGSSHDLDRSAWCSWFVSSLRDSLNSWSSSAAVLAECSAGCGSPCGSISHVSMHQASSTGDCFLSRRETRIVPGVAMPPTSAQAHWSWSSKRLKTSQTPLAGPPRPHNPYRWNQWPNQPVSGFAWSASELESRFDAA